MKRTVAALTVLMVVISFVACGAEGSGGSGPQVTEVEAQEGFAVAFGSFFMAAMSAAFGQPPEGVLMNEDGSEFTFDSFDVGQLETVYTTMSGTFTEKDGGMVADVTLEGGPVTSLFFEMDENFDLENAAQIDVTANGHDMSIGLADLDSLGM